jgi:methyl-accepting chemotaxis protein
VSRISNLPLRGKLLGAFATVIALCAVVAFVGWRALDDNAVRIDGIYGDQFGGEVLQAKLVQISLEIEVTTADVLSETDAAARTKLIDAAKGFEKEFDTTWDDAWTADTDGADHDTLDAIKAAYTPWKAVLDTDVLGAAASGDVEAAATALHGKLSDMAGPLDTALQAAEQRKIDVAKENFDATVSSAASATQVIIIVTALVLVLSLALALVLARSIVGRMKQVQATLAGLTNDDVAELQEGLDRINASDLTYAVSPVTPLIDNVGRDEIGQTAASANTMRDKLVAMIGAYNEARTGLSALVTEVKDASDAVAQTADGLQTAAGQSSAAIGQVAQTIGQIAAGAADQARAASDTSTAVGELGSVIGSVGGGAADTSRRVEAASATIGQMTTAIGQASAASVEVGEVTDTAAAAAAGGATAVRETVAGMERIKSAVAGASVRVTELGAKGEQIGAIVETINDIAEQTNLLALNAAIEAARAGEMGKGFAVVADEVRKLAERSGRATKEIADLISQVQAGTKQAVEAMTVGASEVETGTGLAARSGAALDEIAAAVSATKGAVGRITSAVEAMSTASSGVVGAIDGIARIAEETNAGASSMTAGAATVTRSVESIAAVSQENSAAAEEVSAATEELSAQSDQVVGSAQQLAAMATQLDGLVARFKLASGAAPASAGSVVQRRRESDWKAA